MPYKECRRIINCLDGRCFHDAVSRGDVRGAEMLLAAGCDGSDGDGGDGGDGAAANRDLVRVILRRPPGARDRVWSMLSARRGRPQSLAYWARMAWIRGAGAGDPREEELRVPARVAEYLALEDMEED